ncbi:MAG TPA: proton-conducting transporter membrane subunit [Pantanalinema sp.]
MIDLRLLLPDALVLVLLLGALVAWRLPAARTRVGLVVSYGLVAAAGVQLGTLLVEPGGASSLGTMVSLDAFAGFSRLLILVSGAAVSALAGDHLRAHPARARFYTWLLLATSGAMLLPAAADWAVVALALEAMAIGASLLIGWDRAAEGAPQSRLRAEAAFKSYLPSAVATILLLFGASWLFGLTGTTALAETGSKLFDLGTTTHAPMLLAVVLVLGGASCKALLVPFQAWAMDVAEGGAPVALAFVLTAPVVAAFAFLARLLPGALMMARDLWAPALLLMGVASMVLGSLLAIAQSRLTRMVAAAAIAQAGFLALALVACAHPDAAVEARAALLVALGAYVASTLGACAAIASIAEGTGQTELGAYRGLARRHPWLVGALAASLLGLSGLPPFAGFWGKILVFKAVIGYAIASQAYGLVWWVVFAALQMALSAYYYMRAPRLSLASYDPTLPPFEVSSGAIAVAAAAVLALVLPFVAPDALWQLATKAVAGL